MSDRSRSGSGRFSRNAVTMARDAQAWALRAERKTYAQIADELGVSNEGARQAVQRYAGSIADEKIADVRNAVLEQLDFYERELVALLRRPHYVVTRDGDLVNGPDGGYLIDDMPIIASISTALKVIRERSRLLGLDAPTQSLRRIDVISHDAFMVGLERLEAEVKALEGKGPTYEIVSEDDDADEGERDD